MVFIKKKNLLDSEELLYTPQLHWMYIIKPMVSIIVLVIVWRICANSLVSLFYSPRETMVTVFTRMLRGSINYTFLTLIFIALLFLVRRIFMYMNNEYGVTNKRLLIKKGIIRVSAAEIPIDRIEGMYCLQGIFGRIFNYGTIGISGIGGMKPVFYMVCRPYALRRRIVNIIEKNKTITVVHGDLPKPIAKPPKAEPKEEPMYRYGTFVRILPESSQ